MNTAGLLVLDKPAGLSSHAAVQRVRRALGVRRAGHAGTLDPLATGVLLVAVGRATRLLEYLTAQDKGYRATIRVGVLTDTLDREGRTVASLPVPELRPEQMQRVLRGFVGLQRQTAPAFSAIKRGGERLYRRARRGENVEAPVRDVTVYALELVEWTPPDLTVDVLCSKGTYIRSLARDLGEAMGSAGTLWQLCRTRSGEFSLDHAITLAKVETTPDAAAHRLLSPAQMVADLPRVVVDPDVARALAEGRGVPRPNGLDGICAVLAENGELLAVGRVAAGELRPHKVLWSPA